MMKIKYIKDESGIFSNFLRTIDWLWLGHYTGIEIDICWASDQKDLLDEIIDFKCSKSEKIPDFYTSNWVERDAEKFDLFRYKGFHDRRLTIPYYMNYVMNGYPGYFYTNPHVYDRSDFPVLRKEFNKIIKTYANFNENFINKNCYLSSAKKTLGVHLRCPIHYCYQRHNGEVFKHDNFFEENANFIVNKFMNGSFDQVYVACDAVEFIENLKNKLPNDVLIYHQYDRGDSDKDWFDKDRTMEAEIFNMMVDFVNLSKCDYAILSTSNVAFSLLCYNLNIDFEIFPMLKHIHGM